MKNKKLLVLKIILLFLAIGLTLLSFSFTNNGQLIFFSGLFLDDKNIIEFNFNSVILGTIAMILCAIGLNSAGEIMQASTSNPLASPFSLGLTSTINLVYIINASTNYQINDFLIGFLSIFLIFCFNIIPTHFLRKNMNYKTQNNIIYFGIAISSLLTTISLILVHLYSLDAYVYGWIVNYNFSVSTTKLIAGLTFILIGISIVLLNVKNISVFESMKAKSNTLGINNKTINIITLIAASFLAVGASMVYAPLFMLGLVIPYITKKFIIQKFSFKHSIIISTLISIILIFISRFLLFTVKLNDYNLMFTILLLPTWAVIEIINKQNRKKTYGIQS